MFDYIIDPNSKNYISVYSEKGLKLIHDYIKSYKNGGNDWGYGTQNMDDTEEIVKCTGRCRKPWIGSSFYCPTQGEWSSREISSANCDSCSDSGKCVIDEKYIHEIKRKKKLEDIKLTGLDDERDYQELARVGTEEMEAEAEIEDYEDYRFDSSEPIRTREISNDKIYILPCTNEKKTFHATKWMGLSSSYLTPENYSGRPKIISGPEEEKLYLTKNGNWTQSNCSDKKILGIDEDERKLCTFNDTLDYSGMSGIKSCDRISISEYWMFFRERISQVLNLSKHPERSVGNTDFNCFIVGHHNRMKYQFLPLKNPGRNAYANCFCLKLSNETGRWKSNVVHSGFPDKLGHYNYIQNDIDFEKFKDEDKWMIIIAQLDLLIPRDSPYIINFYFVRHGNSFHNKPESIKMIDSPLTPIGLYQAYLLGKKIRRGFNQHIPLFLFSSYLVRSQQTSIEMAYSTLQPITNFSPKLDNLSKLYDYRTFSILSTKHRITDEMVTKESITHILKEFGKRYIDFLLVSWKVDDENRSLKEHFSRLEICERDDCSDLMSWYKTKGLLRFLINFRKYLQKNIENYIETSDYQIFTF